MKILMTLLISLLKFYDKPLKILGMTCACRNQSIPNLFLLAKYYEGKPDLNLWNDLIWCKYIFIAESFKIVLFNEYF